MTKTTFRDMVGDNRIEDRGAMPKEFYRRMTIKCYDCQDRPMDITLNPNETFDIRGCKGKPISWEGKLKWDGRRITGTERRGVFDLFRR
jgi:hypothetical protein